ncbi:MAG TPA: hypothetical protein PK156_40730 [Polyangium sp.]|nr:hypothetical protein [Polyangium sp.]
MRDGTFYVDIRNNTDLSVREAQIIRALVRQRFDTLIGINMTSSLVQYGQSDLSEARFKDLIGHTQRWADELFPDLEIHVRWEDSNPPKT